MRSSAESATASIRGSMLWAAYGDALGFMTELVDPAGVARRTGVSTVTTTIPWTYRVGGRYGVDVAMPSGAYSDDTQLRLATARCISTRGAFDVDAFAKVELPVWLGYALGAGRGSKAAAANLARPNVQWFTNFFEARGQRYVLGGGNGAAMRIQPHVWAGGELPIEKLVLGVIQNSITTHGHPRAIVGAVLHALVLREALSQGVAPPPEVWLAQLDFMRHIRDFIMLDDYLGGMWLPEWERQSGSTFRKAIFETLDECGALVRLFLNIDRRATPNAYEIFVSEAGGLDAASRGSGTITAIAACVLAHVSEERADEGLRRACNLLGSDTDTIATMAGALMGTRGLPMRHPIQDRDLLVEEASRLAAIGAGSTRDSNSGFAYPSLLDWKVPRAATALVEYRDGSYSLAGLGPLAPVADGGEVMDPRSRREWQWMRTAFGQSVLLRLPASDAPTGSAQLPLVEDEAPAARLSIGPEVRRNRSEARLPARPPEVRPALEPEVPSLHAVTQEIIRSGFDPLRVGEALLAASEGEYGIENAAAFAAIIAKARLARRAGR